MKTMLLKAYIAAQLRKDEGATAVEYALLVGLIALVIIVGVTLLGTNLLARFNQAASSVAP
jgi:pilus assembly protein Flp/PilA